MSTEDLAKFVGSMCDAIYMRAIFVYKIIAF